MKTIDIILILVVTLSFIFIIAVDDVWCEEGMVRIDCDNDGWVYKAREVRAWDSRYGYSRWIYFKSGYFDIEKSFPLTEAGSGKWDMRCDEEGRVYVATFQDFNLTLWYSIHYGIIEGGDTWERIDIPLIGNGLGRSAIVEEFKMFPTETGIVYLLSKLSISGIPIWQLTKVDIFSGEVWGPVFVTISNNEPDLVIAFDEVYLVACGIINQEIDLELIKDKDWDELYNSIDIEIKLGKVESNDAEIEITWEDIVAGDVKGKYIDPKICSSLFGKLYILWEGIDSDLYLSCFNSITEKWLCTEKKIIETSPIIYSDVISDLCTSNNLGSSMVRAVWTSKDNGTEYYYSEDITGAWRDDWQVASEESCKLKIASEKIPSLNCAGMDYEGNVYVLFFEQLFAEVVKPLFARTDLEDRYKVVDISRWTDNSKILADVVTNSRGNVYVYYSVKRNNIYTYYSAQADRNGDSWRDYEPLGDLDTSFNSMSTMTGMKNKVRGISDSHMIDNPGFDKSMNADLNQGGDNIILEKTDFGTIPNLFDGNDDPAHISNLVNSSTIPNTRVGPIIDSNGSSGTLLSPGIKKQVYRGVNDTSNNTPPAEEDSGSALHGVGKKDINISSDIYNYNKITTNGERVGISVPDVDPVPDSNNSSRNDPKYNKVGSVNKQRAGNLML